MSIDSFSNEDFVKLKGELALTAFLGSAISIWEPTNLPTGKAFTKALFNALFFDDEGKLDDPLGLELETLFEKIPFENVMEKCPDPNTLISLLKRIFNVSTYNNIHSLLVQTLIDEKIHSLITTNYDCCLEQAFVDAVKQPQQTAASLLTVVRKEDLDSECKNAKLCFKIHGTADDNNGETLVFLLRQESALPKWKRTLFQSLLEDRVLLIIGYSGTDFEICPEIPLTRVKQILWNFRLEKEITTNARRVMEQVPGIILIGDMKLLLSKIFSPVDIKPGNLSLNIEQEIRDNFSATTRLLWRIRLLNSMSYGTSALQLCGNILEDNLDDSSFRIAVLEEYARALHYGGAYKSAARAYEKAISIANESLLPKSKVRNLLLDASDNWRCYGNFFKSYRRLKAARSLAIYAEEDSDPSFLARANLKELLLLRRRYQIAQFFRLKFLVHRIRVRAKHLISSAAGDLLSDGSWFEFQQLRLWAERFDLPPELTKPPDFYEAPPPRDGYEHLGFPMAQMMVFRDAVDTDQLPLKKETATEALDKYKLAQQIGLRTEAWKLSYLLLKKFPEYRNKELILGFLKNFNGCEYSLIMRVMLLLIRP